MNFNLVSPTTNGNEYTVRFNEPITIDADSQIYMNFAQLERENLVELSEDQNITINIQSKHVYPRVYPEDPTLENDPFYTSSDSGLNVATIKKDTYTYGKLAEAIASAVNRLFYNKEPPQRSNLESYTSRDAANLVLNRDNDIVVGVVLGGTSPDYRYALRPMTEDTTNLFGASIVDGEFSKSSATAVTPLYDCYTLSNEHYHHLQMKCDSKAIANNLIQMTTNQAFNDQVGKLTMGLYSNYYAADLGGNFSRTTGSAAPKLDAAGNLNAFLTVEITPGATGEVILRLSKSAQGSIEDWTNINQEITEMEEIVRIPVSDSRVLNNQLGVPLSFAFQTYIRSDDLSLRENPNMYFRIFTRVGGDGSVDKQTVWYDSVVDNRYIPHSFLVATSGLDYDSARRVNSQIPFNVIMSATIQGEGFDATQMRIFNKVKPTPSPEPVPQVGNEVQSLFTQYTLSYSDELGKVLGGFTTGNLYPNICVADIGEQFVADMSGLWKRKSYSIYLENLPINNYKNTELTRNAGFTKAILANVPVPFGKDSELISGEGTTDNGSIVAVYQPYNPIYSDMKNNVIQTNQFNVKIVDMSDETPAVDITKSTINFTIRSAK
jgi:hypothetical protein